MCISLGAREHLDQVSFVANTKLDENIHVLNHDIQRNDAEAYEVQDDPNYINTTGRQERDPLPRREGIRPSST